MTADGTTPTQDAGLEPPSIERVRELFCDGLLLHEGMESERPARRRVFDRALQVELARRQQRVAERLDQALRRVAQGGPCADLVDDVANLLAELTAPPGCRT